MKTYAEERSNAAARFDMSAKLAKLAMHSTDAGSGDYGTISSQAISNLHEAGAEIVAIKARGDQLTPNLKQQFNKLNDHLDEFVGAGPQDAFDRHTILKRLTDFVKEPIFDVDQCTLALNKPLPLHLKPLKEIQARVGPRVRSSKQCSFTDEAALKMGMDLILYRRSLTRSTKNLDSVFSEAHKSLDDISPNGSKLQFDDTMLEELKTARPELHAVAMAYNQSLEPDLPSPRRGSQRLTPSLSQSEAFGASPPEIPSSTRNTPSPLAAGTKRRHPDDRSDSAEAEELQPTARRRKLNPGSKARANVGAEIEIYADPPASPPRSTQTIGSSPPGFEDTLGRQSPLQPIADQQSRRLPPDADKENKPPERDRLRDRQRDNGTGL